MDELNQIIADYQHDKNEVEMRNLTRNSTIISLVCGILGGIGLISVFNDALQLKDRFTGADAIKAIVSIFMPGSV
ncbi:MAG: hypothetical protein II929_08410 [Succinivibrio sp.]|nr:hypothetical protein [Succinivibrio sp.]